MELSIPVEPRAPAEARRSVVAGLSEARAPAEAIDDASLLTSELVTNVVLHGPPGPQQLLLVIDVADGVLRIEVGDGGPGFVPSSGPPPAGSAGGWGLWLVDQLADRWGVRADPTLVWFELDLPAAPRTTRSS